MQLRIAVQFQLRGAVLRLDVQRGGDADFGFADDVEQELGLGDEVGGRGVIAQVFDGLGGGHGGVLSFIRE